ncbi:hypothetical protein AB6A40_004899 [Gnathostoma spinigerum]|uniref:Uncharacterized protein n=1 Tax=Gnathostoma spinigerum TaxID=75299 RepID=A0ABD6EF15_9BILA
MKRIRIEPRMKAIANMTPTEESKSGKAKMRQLILSTSSERTRKSPLGRHKIRQRKTDFFILKTARGVSKSPSAKVIQRRSAVLSEPPPERSTLPIMADEPTMVRMKVEKFDLKTAKPESLTMGESCSTTSDSSREDLKLESSACIRRAPPKAWIAAREEKSTPSIAVGENDVTPLRRKKRMSKCKLMQLSQLSGQKGTSVAKTGQYESYSASETPHLVVPKMTLATGRSLSPPTKQSVNMKQNSTRSPSLSLDKKITKEASKSPTIRQPERHLLHEVRKDYEGQTKQEPMDVYELKRVQENKAISKTKEHREKQKSSEPLKVTGETENVFVRAKARERENALGSKKAKEENEVVCELSELRTARKKDSTPCIRTGKEKEKISALRTAREKKTSRYTKHDKEVMQQLKAVETSRLAKDSLRDAGSSRGDLSTNSSLRTARRKSSSTLRPFVLDHIEKIGARSPELEAQRRPRRRRSHPELLKTARAKHSDPCRSPDPIVDSERGKLPTNVKLLKSDFAFIGASRQKQPSQFTEKPTEISNKSLKSFEGGEVTSSCISTQENKEMNENMRKTHEQTQETTIGERQVTNLAKSANSDLPQRMPATSSEVERQHLPLDSTSAGPSNKPKAEYQQYYAQTVPSTDMASIDTIALLIKRLYESAQQIADEEAKSSGAQSTEAGLQVTSIRRRNSLGRAVNDGEHIKTKLSLKITTTRVPMQEKRTSSASTVQVVKQSSAKCERELQSTTESLTRRTPYNRLPIISASSDYCRRGNSYICVDRKSRK